MNENKQMSVSELLDQLEKEEDLRLPEMMGDPEALPAPMASAIKKSMRGSYVNIMMT